MKKILTIILVLLLVLIGGYSIWSVLGRTPPVAAAELYLDDMSVYGADAGRGNLIAVQPYMEPGDYATAAAFHAKLDGYMAAARDAGWLRANTIVVFPEQIGTWLVAAGEKHDLYEAETLNSALQLMVISNAPDFVRAYTQAEGRDKITDAVFRMKAATMAGIYDQTFSRLARDYGVTVVAGSLFLPGATVSDGHVVAGPGPLQGVGAVYRPDGTPEPRLVRKIYILNDEAEFASPGSVEQLPVFDTPAGRLAVLICADAWYPAAYAPLAAQQPDIIAVPNHYPSQIGWDEPWGGYNPGPTPDDVDVADVGRISEGQARVKYTLDGRMQQVGATTGIHAYFRGTTWDMTTHGHTIIFTTDGVIEAPAAARGAVVNYWLP